MVTSAFPGAVFLEAALGFFSASASNRHAQLGDHEIAEGIASMRSCAGRRAGPPRWCWPSACSRSTSSAIACGTSADPKLRVFNAALHWGHPCGHRSYPEHHQVEQARRLVHLDAPEGCRAAQPAALCKELGASRTTLRMAMDILVQEGLVAAKPGPRDLRGAPEAPAPACLPPAGGTCRLESDPAPGAGDGDAAGG